MAYTAADDRYDSMTYRRTGRSGLDLPAVSLGLWHNFGDDVPFDRQRAILRRALDLGVTHFDLANNYGPPYGSAETNFGRHLRDDFRPYRDELVVWLAVTVVGAVLEGLFWLAVVGLLLFVGTAVLGWTKRDTRV